MINLTAVAFRRVNNLDWRLFIGRIQLIVKTCLLDAKLAQQRRMTTGVICNHRYRRGRFWDLKVAVNYHNLTALRLMKIFLTIVKSRTFETYIAVTPVN